MAAACQNTTIPEKETEGNERKTGRESIKGKGEELGSEVRIVAENK